MRTLPSRVIGLTLVYVLCSKKCVAINRSCETVPREIFERLRARQIMVTHEAVDVFRHAPAAAIA